MSSDVTLNELNHMRRVVAELILADSVYLPIFERIEHELATWQSRDRAIDRARVLLAGYKAAA